MNILYVIGEIKIDSKISANISMFFIRKLSIINISDINIEAVIIESNLYNILFFLLINGLFTVSAGAYNKKIIIVIIEVTI